MNGSFAHELLEAAKEGDKEASERLNRRTRALSGA
jgi:hypothetical protein